MDDFKPAKACFLFSAIIAEVRIFMWGIGTSSNGGIRILSCFLAFGIIGTLLVESFRYVDRKRNAKMGNARLIAEAKAESQLEIIYKQDDLENNNRRIFDRGIKCPIHFHTIIVRNNSDRSIEGIKVTLKSVVPSDAPELTPVTLWRTSTSPKPDMLNLNVKVDAEFSLAARTEEQVDVVFADPMHPQQSFVAHTDNTRSRVLPSGKHTLELVVSANNERAVTRFYDTEYNPDTGELVFGEHGATILLENNNSYRQFLRSDIQLVPSYSKASASRQLRAGVRWHNVGSEKVINAYVFSAFFIADLSKQTTLRQKDDKSRRDFEELRMPMREKYLAGTLEGKDIDSKAATQLVSVATRSLTRADIDNVRNGTAGIYLISWLVWKDGDSIAAAWDCRCAHISTDKEALVTLSPCIRDRY